jgi:phosphohistidine phosphatase
MSTQKLYLVQHAKAAPKEVDPQKSLTEEGLRDIQKVAEFIKPLNICVDYLWHSGKKRAVQTAEALAKVIKINKTLTEHKSLGPTDDVTTLKTELSYLASDTIIVGHQPFLGKLASLLLTGYESTNIVVFKNAGIVCMGRSEDKWHIDWMLTAELLVD